MNYVHLYFVGLSELLKLCEKFETSTRGGPSREEALVFGHVALALIRRWTSAARTRNITSN
jgi:hypothetical protein